MADSDILVDEDCPELTERQLKILSLVLSHKGVRGNARVSFYYQGMEEERLASLQNLMDTMNMTLAEAMEALRIPSSEYEKYARVMEHNEPIIQ